MPSPAAVYSMSPWIPPVPEPVAGDVLAVGVDHQDPELPQAHGRRAEDLHEVGLAHAGGREDAHVARERLRRERDGHALEDAEARAHLPDLEVAHGPLQELEVRVVGAGDHGEVRRGRDRRPEPAVVVDEAQRVEGDAEGHPGRHPPRGAYHA